MLYRIDSNCMLGCLKPKRVLPDEQWSKSYDTNGLCSSCNCIERSRYPKPLDVVLANPPEGQTYAKIEGTGVTVWRRDLLEIMKPYLGSFTLGNCFLANGLFLEQYVACYSINYIVIRGNRQCRYQSCNKCQTITSHLEPGPEYVLSCDLTDEKIYQDVYCRMYLTEDIAWNLGLENYGDDTAFVALSPLLVRDAAGVDGFYSGGCYGQQNTDRQKLL